MPEIIRHKWEEFAQLGLDRSREHAPMVMAVDTETTGLGWKDTPFGMTVAWRGPTRTESFWFELEDEKPLAFAANLLHEHAARGGLFRFFNAKFDIIMLAKIALWPLHENWRFEDVAPMVALLEPSGERGLKAAAQKYLGRSVDNAAQVKKAQKELGTKVADGYWPLPREVVVPYALDDAEMTLELGDVLLPKLEAEGLDYAYGRESLLLDELILMEMRGMAIDLDAVKAEIKVCDQRMEKARTEIEAIVGKPVSYDKQYELVEVGTYKNGNPKYKRQEIPTFNPNSNPQVLAYFHEQGIHLENTQEATFAKVDHPLCEQLVILSKEQKLRNTYLMKLIEQTDENGIVHPGLNPGGTQTGRFSSGGSAGNWQNLPSHDDRAQRLKSCIRPKLDAFLCVDYEAMEFRVAAFYLVAQPTINDTAFADEIKRGEDPHYKTAQLIEKREEVTKAERDKAKRTMFSMLYQGSGRTIWLQGLVDSLQEGYEFVERFHRARPQIKMLERAVMRATKRRQAEEGVAYVKSLWGRKLSGDTRFPLTRYVWSPAAGEKVEILNRPLVNYLIQGSSSDLMKDAIIRVAQFLRDGMFESHIVLTIHDEIILDCREDEIDAIALALPGLMGNAQVEEVLPLSVEIEIARPTWADQGPYEIPTRDSEPVASLSGATGSPDGLLPWEDE
jgi:DNA polymerase-1